MAHIHAFGDAAPAARGIIHLGATSMDVVDNADLIMMRDAIVLLHARLLAVAALLADFCEEYADLPTLGFTHLQPAQLTTVGKRATLWLSDLLVDLHALDMCLLEIHCRGLRGATGTQASFHKLLKNAAKVRKLESQFAMRLGFIECYPVTGQTYSRKVDLMVVNVLSSFAASVPQDLQRHPPAGDAQGDRGAVRKKPGRQLGDGVQAQPDALRTRHRPGGAT